MGGPGVKTFCIEFANRKILTGEDPGSSCFLMQLKTLIEYGIVHRISLSLHVNLSVFLMSYLELTILELKFQS